MKEYSSKPKDVNDVFSSLHIIKTENLYNARRREGYSAERLNLRTGKTVYTVVKASDVMIGID